MQLTERSSVVRCTPFSTRQVKDIRSLNLNIKTNKISDQIFGTLIKGVFERNVTPRLCQTSFHLSFMLPKIPLTGDSYGQRTLSRSFRTAFTTQMSVFGVYEERADSMNTPRPSDFLTADVCFEKGKPQMTHTLTFVKPLNMCVTADRPHRRSFFF